MVRINKIILASNNEGKVREIQQLLEAQSFLILPQSEYSVPEAEEVGVTFIENALIKARHASSITGLPTIADDSGLVVPALNGEPGIFSARYAGKNATNSENIEKLLFNLRDVPASHRQAFFYCIIVFLSHAEDPCPIVCEGRWDGEILFQPRGKQGFGYDPIFYVPMQQCSAAELTSELKNNISHRGQAMQKLIKKITTHIQ